MIDNINTPRVILKVAVPSPLRNSFDYLPPADEKERCLPGMRVLVPFGRRQVIGMILEVVEASEIKFSKLKPIIKVLDLEPLFSKTILDLIEWASNYYHHPIGDVLVNAIPVLLRDIKLNGAVIGENKVVSFEIKDEQIKLNTAQAEAVDAINRTSEFKTFLLAGITGSGKTEVYLQVIAKVLKEGKQALVLVPEINLTPQTIERFSKRFAVPMVVLHSRVTNKERLNSWALARSGVAKIVIGTRSAIFTPMPNLGIIILDEEHDWSFKQQNGLRYSARDLAVMRGKIENIRVVLGSATPSFESINNVDLGRYAVLNLPERIGRAGHPTFQIVDLRNQSLQEGISTAILKAIEERLEKNEQVLIFLNRRGFAPMLVCKKCGWTAECKYCDAKLIVHQREQRLHCHHCGLMQRIPTKCPKCEEKELFAMGVGTERIEAKLQECFPQAKLIRIDRDTTRRKGSIQTMLKKINQNEYQILIGTQMLAKGHHFPEVTMSAILNADQGLFSSDFRANEQIAQMIIQVAGRAGRAEKPGIVYIQTYNPTHPLLIKLLKEGYQSFAAQSLQERKMAKLPPFSSLALIRAEAKKKEATHLFLKELVSLVENKLLPGVRLVGPIAALMERKAGLYHAQLLLQSSRRDALHKVLEKVITAAELLKSKHKVKWIVEVDPQSILG